MRGASQEFGIKVRRGLDALGRLDGSAALREFGELARRSPSNGGYRDAAALAERLHAAGDDLDSLCRAYFEHRRAVPAMSADSEDEDEGADIRREGRRVVARAIAERAERERGPGGRAAGMPIARLFVEAGDATRARACAEAALRADGESADLLACLGDAYALEGDEGSRAEARDLYRRALLLDPKAVDLTLVVDSEVRDLRSLAELEYEVPGEPEPWLVTVGFLERVLPIAHYDEEDFARLGPEGMLSVAVEPGSASVFYHYLRVSESHHSFGPHGEALRLEARKRLKQIAPKLYAHYLARF